MSNCLGKKVVDDCDLIFEFGVGRNFGVQEGALKTREWTTWEWTSRHDETGLDNAGVDNVA